MGGSRQIPYISRLKKERLEDTNVMLLMSWIADPWKHSFPPLLFSSQSLFFLLRSSELISHWKSKVWRVNKQTNAGSLPQAAKATQVPTWCELTAPWWWAISILSERYFHHSAAASASGLQGSHCHHAAAAGGSCPFPDGVDASANVHNWGLLASLASLQGLLEEWFHSTFLQTPFSKWCSTVMPCTVYPALGFCGKQRNRQDRLL